MTQNIIHIFIRVVSCSPPPPNPNRIKNPPRSAGLTVTGNLWAGMETEMRNCSVSNKEDLKKVLREEPKRSVSRT
jgi:hypothetical protein